MPPLPDEHRGEYQERRIGACDWRPIDADTLRLMIGTRGRGWRIEMPAMKQNPETVLVIGEYEYRWID